jgi:hypothetical protein
MYRGVKIPKRDTTAATQAKQAKKKSYLNTDVTRFESIEEGARLGRLAGEPPVDANPMEMAAPQISRDERAQLKPQLWDAAMEQQAQADELAAAAERKSGTIRSRVSRFLGDPFGAFGERGGGRASTRSTRQNEIERAAAGGGRNPFSAISSSWRARGIPPRAALQDLSLPPGPAVPAMNYPGNQGFRAHAGLPPSFRLHLPGIYFYHLTYYSCFYLYK